MKITLAFILKEKWTKKIRQIVLSIALLQDRMGVRSGNHNKSVSESRPNVNAAYGHRLNCISSLRMSTITTTMASYA